MSHPQEPDRSLKSSKESIATWLKDLGLECYIITFQREHIDFKSLPHLDEEHLKELGVSIGHRIVLKKAIQELQEDQSVSQELQVECVYKVIVVGDLGTGKTSLIQRYTSGIFNSSYKATIGVDFCLKEIRWNRNTTISLQLWDIAGQERFANLTRMYYREARGAFVVFDITQPKTFHGVLKWKKDIDAKLTLPNGDLVPVVLLANKCDLSTQPPDETNLDDFSKEHKFIKWFFTSAKENIGIEEATNFLVNTMLNNDQIRSHQSQEYKGLNLSKPNPKKKDDICCH